MGSSGEYRQLGRDLRPPGQHRPKTRESIDPHLISLARANPPLLDGPSVLALQRIVGNAAVASLLEEDNSRPTVQRGKTKAKTAPDRLKELEGRGLVTIKQSLAVPLKTGPKHPGKYTTTAYGGRTYYYRTDPSKRTIKISGPLVYTKGDRKPTAKVPYKRKTDASGHLIAHSFGGPPSLTQNYVAMNKFINSAGGDWGKVEGYIRTRLKQKGIGVWMAVLPQYSGVSKRPHEIWVRLRFNKSPYVVRFKVLTP